MGTRLLVYDPAGGTLAELNSTAGLVVALADGTRSVAEIAELLADAYPDSAAAVRDDVPRIVDDLVEREVLECR